MSNTICLNNSSNNDLSMSNAGTSMFINILCLSGGRIAKTESQKQLMVYLAEKNQSICGIGTVGFDIVEMPWNKRSFDEDKRFMLNVIDGAFNKLGWKTLDYEPNEDFASEYLNKFKILINKMSVNDIVDDSLTIWLSEADDNDPIKCGFPKCKIHDAYISTFGCQVCTD